MSNEINPSEVEALAAKATRGEIRAMHDECPGIDIVERLHSPEGDFDNIIARVFTTMQPCAKELSDFICAARTNWPLHAKRLVEAEARIKELEALLLSCRSRIDDLASRATVSGDTQ